MRVSYRRLILIGYVGLLFLATHMPLPASFLVRDGNWLDALLSNLTQFGNAMMMGSRDKWLHCAAYLVLALLALWAAAGVSRIGKRIQGNLPGGRRLIILCAVLAWGLLDEATQPIFGRVFDWHDFLANALGAGLAVGIVAIALGSKRLRPAGRAADLLVDAPVVS